MIWEQFWAWLGLLIEQTYRRLMGYCLPYCESYLPGEETPRGKIIRCEKCGDYFIY